MDCSAGLAERGTTRSRSVGTPSQPDTCESLLKWHPPPHAQVVRVEMQSQKPGLIPGRPVKMTMANTVEYIYKENGIKGFFRGVTPRIGLSVWRTVCLVSLSDVVKDTIEKKSVTVGEAAKLAD